MLIKLERKQVHRKEKYPSGFSDSRCFKVPRIPTILTLEFRFLESFYWRYYTYLFGSGQSLTSKQQIVNSVLFMYCLLWSTVGQTESTQALLKILTPFLSRNINQLSWSLNTFREERSYFLLHFLSIRGGRQINVHFFLQPGTCVT